MTAVFVGGSRQIKHLDAEIRGRLADLVEGRSRFLVGDANGADKALQAYLRERRYPDVTVFCTLSECRNNLAQWPVERVRPPHRTRDFAFFTAKDAEMARRADMALMLWDGKSAGTMVNAARLVAARKPTVVYVAPQKAFRTLESPEDLDRLLESCPEEEKTHIHRRITEHVGEAVQLSVF